MTLVKFASEREAQKAVQDAKHGIGHFTKGVYGLDEEVAVLVGSGTTLKLCDEFYMLTASHVLDTGYTKYPALARTVGTAAITITDGWTRSMGGLDLALAQIDDVSTDFVAVDALAANSAGVGDAHLFVNGFPDRCSRTSVLLESTVSKTMPYITYESQTPTTYDRHVHFEIDWDPTQPQRAEDGSELFLPSAVGVSGSAVWSLGSDATAVGLSTGAQIIGVAHQFHQERRSLVVVRIEFIREFLLHAVRERAAYLNWRARGCPPFGAEMDWRRAEDQVAGLW